MRACERKRGGCMIEGGGYPARLRVTGAAGRGEAIGYMRRIHRLIEILLMTLDTIAIHQLVVAIHMTGLAGLCSMRALQRELRRSVIKRRGLPSDIGMTLRAIVRELRRRVIGLKRGVEIRRVALPAIGVLQLVVAVHMAGLAGLGRMRALQRKLRRCVIKRRGLPSDIGMALRAIVRKLRRSVIGLHNPVEIRRVALPAIGVL